MLFNHTQCLIQTLNKFQRAIFQCEAVMGHLFSLVAILDLNLSSKFAPLPIEICKVCHDLFQWLLSMSLLTQVYVRFQCFSELKSSSVDFHWIQILCSLEVMAFIYILKRSQYIHANDHLLQQILIINQLQSSLHENLRKSFNVITGDERPLWK